ncbi:alpha/beta hydrolase [Actinorhabdospora filicis]|uniref:Alpha/beta hydrolase n=1 Tax=Actinorhabdospora filicis TaxID=1785913 RepID=A0A9W6SQQ4_9ACTN|nr:alpha/beta fold hydrolase [Actinorhabdospora filicis]GLZ79001.1 alpha/beta hydrolase [Actinorhabdospora filicis]
MTRQTITTEDGVRLDAVHRPPRRHSGLAIVVAHGFTGTWRNPRLGEITDVFREHAGVIGFDFRGHGHSGGLSTLGDREVLDVAAAVTHARELGYARVALIGFSMGAAVAVRYGALYGDVTAVASVSGPSRWYYKGTPAMRWLHRAVELRAGRLVSRAFLNTRISGEGWHELPLSPTDAAPLVAPAPYLVVHGDADRYFPLRHAYELHHAAREPKELWIERGMGHAESGTTPELAARLGRWLAESPGD